MDKVKKILEGYAEWIALAAGAGFLLWMVYSYVYQPPVTVTVGPTPATPGEIDDRIWNGPGKVLQGQLASSQAVRVAVPTFGDQVVTALNAAPAAATPISGPFTASALAVIPADGGTPVAPVVQTTAGRTLVTHLPVAPALVQFDLAQGHSNIMPVPAAGGNAPPPVAMPVGMPVGMPGPGAAPVAQAVDRSWVTVGTLFPAAALNDAFTAAKIPTGGTLHQTTVLRILLYRQEMTAAGTWGPEVLIEPPAIDAVPPLPPPVAVNAAAVMAERNYLALAAKTQPVILRPDFYPVVEGDKWYVPGTPNPNPKTSATVDDVFDPTTFKGDPSTLTPAQRDALRKAQAAARTAAAAAAAARRPAARGNSGSPRTGRPPGAPGGPGGNVGRPGGGGGGGEGFVVADPDRPMVEDPAGGPPDGPPGTGPSGANAPGEVPIPVGAFDPAHQPDFKVWAHDDTVQPGKTYRYQLRYVISSPVFLTQQLCNPQALASQFALSSVKTNQWSEAVNVESDSNFYAAGLGTGGTVKFDVFKWQNGVWSKQSTQVAPGDTVGAAIATGTGPNPFATGWTVVDIRELPNDSADRVVLLASDNGTLERDVKTDGKLATYRRLLKLVADATLKANGGGGGGPPPEMGPGGLPPPGMSPGQDAGRQEGGN